MYVDKLKIKNLRGFEQAEMRLNYPGRKYPKNVTPPRLQNVNLLLGENGSGKSTVFRALCIGVLRGYLNGAGFISDDNIRHGTDEAEIDVSLVLNRRDFIFLKGGSKPAPKNASDEESASGNTRIYRRGDTETIESRGRPKRWDESLYFAPSPALFLVAYGANRRTERPEAYNENLRRPRYQQIATLFEPHVGLIPFDYALSSISRNTARSRALAMLNSALPESIRLLYIPEEETGNPEGAYTKTTGWRFVTNNAKVQFNSLSDGYRSFAGWIIDLLWNMARSLPVNGSLTNVRGVVIVDEVDLLLHPSWQRTVVEKLATTFPNLQFLFSTHSPIVAASLEPQNIFVMDTDENGAAIVRQYKEPISGRMVDQVLTSSYFGLDSPRSLEIERELRRLSKVADTDYEAAQKYLQLLKEGF